jgi:hypothetical protein
MTGIDLCVNMYKSVPVIFEPPCITLMNNQITSSTNTKFLGLTIEETLS